MSRTKKYRLSSRWRIETEYMMSGRVFHAYLPSLTDLWYAETKVDRYEA